MVQDLMTNFNEVRVLGSQFYCRHDFRLKKGYELVMPIHMHIECTNDQFVVCINTFCACKPGIRMVEQPLDTALVM